MLLGMDFSDVESVNIISKILHTVHVVAHVWLLLQEMLKAKENY
jgi:hypothetical protein|tara:strand:- start:152 stop:283 length:132 start_codon:yes stop_codon:yes gene_type:complete